MTQDFTQGTIWKQLLFFTLPLIASNLLQQLYNMIDLIFAGQFLGDYAAAAIGTSSRLIFCIINFFSGMATGAGVIISRCFGANNLFLAKKNHGYRFIALFGCRVRFFYLGLCQLQALHSFASHASTSGTRSAGLFTNLLPFSNIRVGL